MFKQQMQQTMLAALSLGPVGISDQLSGSPYNASADITSNKTLVMATCAATGDLLQPSYPLTPIERMLTGGGGFGDCTGANHRAYTFGCGAMVLATYTAVSSSSSSSSLEGRVGGNGGGMVALWWTVIGFLAGRGGGDFSDLSLYVIRTPFLQKLDLKEFSGIFRQPCLFFTESATSWK